MLKFLPTSQELELPSAPSSNPPQGGAASASIKPLPQAAIPSPEHADALIGLLSFYGNDEEGDEEAEEEGGVEMAGGVAQDNGEQSRGREGLDAGEGEDDTTKSAETESAAGLEQSCPLAGAALAPASAAAAKAEIVVRSAGAGAGAATTAAAAAEEPPAPGCEPEQASGSGEGEAAAAEAARGATSEPGGDDDAKAIMSKLVGLCVWIKNIGGSSLRRKDVLSRDVFALLQGTP